VKIKVSKDQEYIPEWHGNKKLPATQQVKATLKPLSNLELFDIMDARSTVGANVRTLLPVAKNILPRFVTLENLEADGSPVTIDDIFDSPFYLGLWTELLNQITNSAVPDEEEAKN
jgi:hypothetical protein